MEVDLNNKALTLAAVRSVQRFLKHQGYRRGKKAGSSSYHLSKSNVLARDSYVKVMHPVVCASPNASVVYLDESFIHQHYKRHNDSLFDPSDDLDVQRKENHKGRRYCFITGILDSPDMECQVAALDIFRGGKSTDKQPKDYHAMFNHDYFVKWFAKLLAEQACRNTDQPAMQKTLQTACTRYGILFEPTDFKSILWEKLSAYIEKHIQPQVVQMAIDKGHRVVFTPPLSLRLATN
ncbi:hypothetical protein DYB25_006576 [Aphanomyces astaci]|uniref:Uncharacterized protein n=1 Tax=Aphanomyces astaci TaxID=112090 RepID=A0A397BQP0_APHAT|nr:hypothetical protein DYB25_006576 [Aphanomyces astaci]